MTDVASLLFQLCAPAPAGDATRLRLEIERRAALARELRAALDPTSSTVVPTGPSPIAVPSVPGIFLDGDDVFDFSRIGIDHPPAGIPPAPSPAPRGRPILRIVK